MPEKKNKAIRVFAPASVSNLGCGFDVFGLALEMPGDEVTVKWSTSGKTFIHKIVGAGTSLPLDVDLNTAGVAVKELLQATGEKRGMEISIKKKMPLGSGLGSSAASAVAAAYAANILLGKPFSKKELIPFVMEGERMACGSGHADNAAPSMLGGIVLVRSLNPLEVIQLPVPKKLSIVVVHPHVELLTRDSRAALNKNVPLKTATMQWANTAALVAALYENDLPALGRSVTDYVAEPVRAKLIPSFHSVKEAALLAGALACSISGSGPSVFALCNNDEKAVASAMRKAFLKSGIRSDVYISKVNTAGARQIF